MPEIRHAVAVATVTLFLFCGALLDTIDSTEAAYVPSMSQTPLSFTVRALLVVRGAKALSEYKHLFPNGRDIDDKYFGHTGSYSLGEDPDLGGEYFGHNELGRDFCAFDRSWNVRLCAADSDADGQTNALEMGDPCCGWTTSNTWYSTTGYTSSDLGHPGDASLQSTRTPPLACQDTWGGQCPLLEWSAPTVSGPGPPAKSAGLRAISIRSSSGNRDDVLVFGLDGSAANKSASACTWSLTLDNDAETAKWSLLSSEQSAPIQASVVGHHSAFAYDAVAHRVVSFGGLMASGEAIGRTGSYNIDTNTWNIVGEPDDVVPEPRYGASAGVIGNVMVIIGGRHANGGGFFNDIWGFNMSTNTWLRLSSSAPVPGIDILSNPAAVLSTTRQVLVTSRNPRQQWLWSYDTHLWERTYFGLIPDTGSEVFALSSSGSSVYVLDCNSSSNGAVIWATSNRTMRGEQRSSTPTRWEMLSIAADTSLTFNVSVAERTPSVLSYIWGSGDLIAGAGRMVALGRKIDSRSQNDVDGDAVVDVTLFQPAGDGSIANCWFAPPDEGEETNTSITKLLVRGYDASTLLKDEAGFYKVGLSWTLHPDGRGARYALRAETNGYVSFAWVNANWPMTDDFQYEGKMYGADGVFGWFDDDGIGHVESYFMPTYESADILAAKKSNDYVNNVTLYRENGFTTLEFERAFEAADESQDVAVDPDGSWMMWAFAHEGLFPNWASEGDLMITHSDRHEAFIEWVHVDRYHAEQDLAILLGEVTTAPPMFCDALHDDSAFELGAPYGANVGNCSGASNGDTCVLICNVTQGFKPLTSTAECVGGQWYFPAVFECEALQCRELDLFVLLENAGLSDYVTVPIHHEQNVVNFVSGVNYSLPCRPGLNRDPSVNALAVLSCSGFQNINGDVFGVWSFPSARSLDAARACEPVTNYCAPFEAGNFAGAFPTTMAATCSGNALGDTCEFSCPAFGYQPASALATCVTSFSDTNVGEWSNSHLECVKITGFCANTVETDIAGALNAVFPACVGPNATVDAACIGQCLPGFDSPTPSVNVTCGVNGRWENSYAIENCTEIAGFCAAATLPLVLGSFQWFNKTQCMEQSTVGSKCHGSCTGSDKLVTISCLSDGSWSVPETFNCEGRCSTKLELNATLSGPACDGAATDDSWEIVVGDECSLTTPIGIQCVAYSGDLVVDGPVLCGSVDFPASCSAMPDYCPPLERQLVPNATDWGCDPPDNSVESICTSQCATGFFPSGSPGVIGGSLSAKIRMQCGLDGMWVALGNNPTRCDPIPDFCPVASEFFAATEDQHWSWSAPCDIGVVGQVCRTSCAFGYYDAESTSKCVADGTWSPGNISVACELVVDYCDLQDLAAMAAITGVINHGRILCTPSSLKDVDVLDPFGDAGFGVPLGTNCSLVCDAGYHLSNGADAGYSRCATNLQLEGQWEVQSSDPPTCIADANYCPAAPELEFQNADWFCEDSRSIGEACYSACSLGFEGPGFSFWHSLNLFNNRSANAVALCDTDGNWRVDDLLAMDCVRSPSICSRAPPSSLGRVWADCSGRSAGDNCSAFCDTGYRYGDSKGVSAHPEIELYGELSFCNATTQQWTAVRQTCSLEPEFCPGSISESVVDFEEKGWHAKGLGFSSIPCLERSLGSVCAVRCADEYVSNDAVAVCESSGQWKLPRLECVLATSEDELNVPGMAQFLTISGERGRLLGLSWNRLNGDEMQPAGYLDLAIRTRQDQGYLGVAFGAVEELMIPGDGVWGWVDTSGEAHILANRMESYLVSELELTGLSDDYVVDWEISVEDGFQTFRVILRLDEVGFSGNLVPIKYAALTHFQWALSDTEGLTMHTEWGALDVNFSHNYTGEGAIATEQHDELDTVEVTYVALVCVCYVGLVTTLGVISFLLPRTFLACNHSCGQLRCCRGSTLANVPDSTAHGTIRHPRSNCWAEGWARVARWPMWARTVTFDGILVAMDWSFMVWTFYGATLAVLVAFFWMLNKTGVEAARSTGWICVAVFALLMIPASRDSFVLKMMRLPFDRAVAHHRALGRAFVVCEIAHLSVILRDWGLTVSKAQENFGTGNVIPVWGWVTFALTLAGAVLSVEWFRRRLFEVFYYSHLVMFFMALWSMAVHINIVPFLTLFGVEQELTKTSLNSFLGFYGGIGLPVLLYIIDRVHRGIVADGACGRPAGYRVIRAEVQKSGGGEHVVFLVVRQPRARHKDGVVPRIQYHAGQYVFLAFPQLSRLESHPYTISSAPPSDHDWAIASNPALVRRAKVDPDDQTGEAQWTNDQFDMKFHIKTLGDHTLALARLVREYSRNPEGIDVRVQGPYGSVRFDPFMYPRIILVAGGIGVTPLISIVETVVREARFREQMKTAGVETGEIAEFSGRQKNKLARPMRQEVILLWSTRSLQEVKLFERVLNGALSLPPVDGSAQEAQGPCVSVMTRVFLTTGRGKPAQPKPPKSVNIVPVSRTYVTNMADADVDTTKNPNESDEDGLQHASNRTAQIATSPGASRRQPRRGGGRGINGDEEGDTELSPSLRACVQRGRPDYEVEFDRFLHMDPPLTNTGLNSAEATVDNNTHQPSRPTTAAAKTKDAVDPESCCVLACGPWQMIVAAQCAAYRRGFIFHKEVFDL